MHRITQSLRTTRRINHLPDLTPLADLAWLLLMFFIMTAELRVPEKYLIDLPTMTGYCNDCGQMIDMQVRIQANGRMWVWIPFDLREKIIDQNLQSQANAATIAFWNEMRMAQGFGFGPNDMPGTKETISRKQKDGVSHVQDLVDWGTWVKSLRPKPRFSIRADRNTSYIMIKKVFSAFQQVHVNRFSLVTKLEKEE